MAEVREARKTVRPVRGVRKTLLVACVDRDVSAGSAVAPEQQVSGLEVAAEDCADGGGSVLGCRGARQFQWGQYAYMTRPL
jgi:hypothetical protein